MANIIDWIGYWDRASMGPRIDHIANRADLSACRMYNPCMNDGVMWDVSDDQMWDALVAYRENAA